MRDQRSEKADPDYRQLGRSNAAPLQGKLQPSGLFDNDADEISLSDLDHVGRGLRQLNSGRWVFDGRTIYLKAMAFDDLFCF